MVNCWAIKSVITKVTFGVKFLKLNYGHLFIALLDEVLYKSCLTVLFLLFRLSVAVSTIIFIPKLNFVITSHFVHFYCTFQCLAAFLTLYLSTCYLFRCWNVLVVYFSWSPQCNLLISICSFILSYLISCLLRFVLFQWGCDWYKWILTSSRITCALIHRL